MKGGGHTINPGFSSTKGILIYTGRFSQVTYDATLGTVVIGSGLVWDTVYERLQEYNVNVVGGRVTGVSWHTGFSFIGFLPLQRDRSVSAASYSAAVSPRKYSIILPADQL